MVTKCDLVLMNSAYKAHVAGSTVASCAESLTDMEWRLVLRQHGILCCVSMASCAESAWHLVLSQHGILCCISMAPCAESATTPMQE
jgi:hypothetical protein